MPEVVCGELHLDAVLVLREVVQRHDAGVIHDGVDFEMEVEDGGGGGAD